MILASGVRYAALEFTLEAGATLHGLAGYFECRLYGDECVDLNISK